MLVNRRLDLQQQILHLLSPGLVLVLDDPTQVNSRR